jgi:membrane-bound inhibitor of C-type lysozyme
MEKIANGLNKKSIIWAIVIILIVVALIIILSSYNNQPAPVSNTSEKTTDNVIYYCNEGIINASYSTSTSSTSSVSLTLQNGNIIVLSQTISGSGIRYENNGTVFVSKGDNAFLTQNNIDTYTNCISGNVTINSETSTYTNTSKIFSFSYPTQFTLSGGELGYTVNWAQQSTSTGLILAQVVIPKSFMPSTNFGDAKFTIGTSADPDAVANCLVYNLGNFVSTTKVMIGNREFTKINFSDAGAGNFYDTTTYRTIFDNQCYAVEYTIHSSNIGNYSPDQGITEFDKAKITGILEQIVNSFKFL